ncbi:MAG: MFS transporter [Rhodoferax sp.]|nr:MFS transporter [Rhodoferax sp.]MCF8208825.1 MFS transporter [Rhodoferax sp.]
MTQSKIRSLFIASTLLILLLALGFGATLSSGSFKKSMTESYVSSFVINGGESVRKIEYALKYGKQLDNFFGIQEILQEVKTTNADVKDVKVILADGRIPYSLETSEGVAMASGPLMADIRQMMRSGGKKTSWQILDKKYNVLIAITDPNGQAIGAMDIVFDENVIAPHANAFEATIMQQTLVAGLIAALLLVIFLLRIQVVDASTGKLRTRQLLTVVLLVIGSCQAILTTLTIVEFQPVYLSTVHRNHALVGQLVQKNLEKVTAKGVPYSNLENVERWMGSIPEAMPEIESILLTDGASKTLYSTQRADAVDNASYLAGLKPESTTRVALQSDASGAKAEAVIALSSAYIASKNRAIVIDALTLLVTTILFSVEIVLFLGLYFGHQAASHRAGHIPTKKRALGDISVVRPQAFVFFLAASMATSFLPVILKNYDPIFGLSENIFLGLPLTIEIFASIVSTMVTGFLLDRHGWRPPFIAGLFIVAAGTLLSALSSSALVFLLARLIVGTGYGFAWMSLRGYVAQSGSAESQTTGFAALNSGIYAGINCGVILGAFLIERLSYSGIFWIALVFMGVAIAFSLAFTANQMPAPVIHRPTRAYKRKSLVFDPQVQLMFVTVAIPTAICLMFLNYFVPVYAKTIGVTPSDVGRLFLLYGLCVVYLGPVLSRTVIKKYSFKVSTTVSFLLIICGLLLFGFMPNPITCAIAVLTLGLSDGIGLVAQNNYFLSLKAVQRHGVGKSLGIFSIVKKIGQTMGPMVFGWLSVMESGIGVLGIVFAVALLFFVFLASRPPKVATA